MKDKLIVKMGVWLAIFAVGLAGAAFAKGVIIKIPDAVFSSTYNGPASVDSANIEFFIGNPPASPVSTAGRTANFSYLLVGGDLHQNSYESLDGSSVKIRSWTGGAPRAQGSHYGISVSPFKASSGPAPAAQFTAVSADFAQDYLADAPVNAPSITSVSESNQRIGDTTDVILQLAVSFSYDVGSAPNKIVASGYDLKYWIFPEDEPADSDTDRVASVASTSWSLPATDPKTGGDFGAGTYYFKVRAKNDFGAGPWSTPIAWPTLSQVSGEGTAEFTFDLKQVSETKLVVNSITIPTLDLTKPLVVTVSKASDLKSVIDNAAGPDKSVVVAIYKWDPVAGQAVGIAFDAEGEMVEGSNDFDLVPGMGIQVYTTEELNITFK